MLSKKKYTTQSSMFFGLEDMLNQKHPMYILANKVDWQMFEDSFSPLYCLDSGGLAPPSYEPGTAHQKRNRIH